MIKRLLFLAFFILMPKYIFADSVFKNTTVVGTMTVTGGGFNMGIVGQYIQFPDGTKQYSSNANGLWVQASSNIYSANDGSVGIGVSTPSHKLYVVGNTFTQGEFIEGGPVTSTSVTNVLETSGSTQTKSGGLIVGGNFEVDGATLTVNNIDAVGIQQHFAIYRDTKTNGTNGGTFTQNIWIPRTLNETLIEVGNSISRINPSSSTIRLTTGTYYINSSAPAYNVANHQTRFFNLSTNATAIVGSSRYSNNGTFVDTQSEIIGVFTSTGTFNYQLEHRCFTTNAVTGLGVTAATGEKEVYAVIEIRRIK